MGKRKDDRQDDFDDDFDDDFESDELDDDAFDSSSWDDYEDEEDEFGPRRKTERRRKGNDWQEDFEEWSRYSDHDRW